MERDASSGSPDLALSFSSRAALVVLLALAGSATAASIGLEGPSLDEIEPAAPPAEGPVKVQVECPSASASEPPMALELAFTHTKSWMNVSLAPDSYEVDPSDCRQEPWTRNATLSVGVSKRAPAYLATRLGLEARLETEDGRQTARDEAVVTPAYHPEVDAYFVESNLTVGPEGTAATVYLENRANGDTRFEFELANQTELQRQGLEAIAPSTVVLRSQATGGENTDEIAKLQIRQPEAQDSGAYGARLELRVSSMYAADTELGHTNRTLELDLRVQPPEPVSPPEQQNDTADEQTRASPLPVGLIVPAAIVALGLARHQRD